MANEFIKQATKPLAGEKKANGLTRGFSAARFAELRRSLRPEGSGDCRYPMYKGLAQLVGMEIVGRPRRWPSRWRCWSRAGQKRSIHFKYTDSTGEDGNFAAKVKRTEEFDAAVPRITALKPDVLIVTGDHSTPSMLASHSWHPVPTLLVAKNCRTDACQKFGEAECLRGGLGQFEAKYLMSLALANAGRLGKFGA